MSAAQIKVWRKRLQDGRESVGSDPRSGRPATSRTPWECWMCMGCIQQIRGWQCKNKRLLWEFQKSVSKMLMQDLVMKHVVLNSFYGFCYREEGTSCCSCWLDSSRYQWTRFSQEGHNFEGDWGIIVLCTIFLYPVSFSINISFFHITWMDTFRTDLIIYNLGA